MRREDGPQVRAAAREGEVVERAADIERAIARCRAEIADIERLLREQKTIEPAPRSRLETLAVEFDTAHPALSASLREFIDLLGRAGL